TATVLRRGSLRSSIDRAGLDESPGRDIPMVDDRRAGADEAILSHHRAPADRGAGRDERVGADSAVVNDRGARPDDSEGVDANAHVYYRSRHDDGALADSGGPPYVGAGVGQGGPGVPPGAYALVQCSALTHMPVAHRHRDRVGRRRVTARNLVPGAEHLVAAVQVVDKSGKGVPAQNGEVADHLPELERAVYEDVPWRAA